ncbi:hypothetical protein HMPREF9336_04211 [Segniliparus rugosus ATCC BAA-974]|uniref:Uncharacterized protein n=1 Tax=Segniliparus rugosus (strain ATCC BAA-974 / DSM 45345 / CCUG 50838 / CIP 108380 / JCM 13579 / CDC 945) TaxID=679197 RepID=U1M2I7_SEGRC|nr:hypothetical protein HMPREF9336_04211 [Segniliparus rugosus ATCC BAA-974]
MAADNQQTAFMSALTYQFLATRLELHNSPTPATRDNTTKPVARIRLAR